MSYFFLDTDPFFNDPFFRDPVASVFDSYVRSRLPPVLALGDAQSSNQNQEGNRQVATTEQNNKQVSTAPRRGLDAFFRGPRLDVTETDKEYIIKADVPGLAKSDVQIHVTDDTLTLEGERKQEHEEKTDRKHVVERSYGKFSRSIRLPPDAQAENAKASLENGVLQISLAKKQQQKEEKKKIEVQ
ncbi:uncharacterized protein SPPG_04653 [Spizellomyces punctatus DAOM BR117]|uniref:SHSP domain-containing protein n=1 Tax=Spizellomyces punctatus (strain DAOM BR117) TaxID=645134 RepID=A0A0L0HHM1_SPIPD|nr:uncharacterized protein SPPG_04653 [Spizellomyces punctatus DAOM BR117]KND00329.1 hypothetical protein SPPG_04653 [Spizellomyces punctatus DAOM BR117]|eukprot:XP_016608368.1 hypothetical protein SPPG_04653 [Spizellomyces punctatus DAOM BR117]